MLSRKHDTHEHHDTHDGDAVRGEHAAAVPASDRAVGHDRAHEEFGGVNVGAAFFGWLVAIGVTIILAGILSAIGSALQQEQNLTVDDATANAETVGIVAAIVLLLVLALAYYTGGYVAGRMSRFDGARQGVAVWVIGLVVTIAAALLGWIAGDQYNVLARINLPNIPVPTDTMSTAGIITALAVLVGTLLAAMAGGKVGRRYHAKVDAAQYR